MTEHDRTIARTRHVRARARRRPPGAPGGPRATVLLDGAQTGGRFALLELREVRGDEPPRHLHHWEDETLYVLDGELTVYFGDASLSAAAGTAVLLPRGVEHSYVVLSGSASMLALYAPSGFEGFFRELADGATGALASLDRVISVAARYGCEITGPPPRSAGRLPPSRR
jgi:quercetin dioxygenase-like cupin family protein